MSAVLQTTREEALQHIHTEVLEEQHRGFDEMDEGWLQIPVQEGFTPLHRSSTAVEIFLQQQKAQGTRYEHVHAGIHGEFVMVPNDDMAILSQCQQEVTDLMMVVSPDFKYFVSQREGPISVEVVSENVVKVGRTLKKEYDSWLEGMKQQMKH